MSDANGRGRASPRASLAQALNADAMASKPAIMSNSSAGQNPVVRSNEVDQTATMPKSKLEDAFDRMLAIARELELPGVSEGTWRGRPCLQMNGTSIIGSKDGQVLVIHCPFDEKELLLEAAANIYFETDHYKGYPAILARPEHMKGDEFRCRIESAWRMRATKRQRAEYDARSASKGASPKARPSG